MESGSSLHSLSLLHLVFLSLSLSLSPVAAIFRPSDNYLVNCGSASNATLFNRVFLADAAEPGSGFLSSTRSVTVKNPNPSKTLSPLYETARVFTAVSSYRFAVKRNGTHVVRFHFSSFPSPKFSLSAANFTVSVNGDPVLTVTETSNVTDTVVNEFILKVNRDKVEIVFSPSGDSSLAYVSAIEVFSAPDDLVVDYGAKFVNADGAQEFKNLSSQILETIHRVNVGGEALTPFNDTLWRSWIPDDEFLVLQNAAKRAVTTAEPNYQKGGASREIAPDEVYRSAREMNRSGVIAEARFNITWKFPVSNASSRHLVRLHFCDIVSQSLNLLFFCVYINGFSAYRDLDLSSLTSHVLASPLYVDFVVDSDGSGFTQVSVGPSELSNPPSRINAILNGAEIMKMVNVVGSAEDGKGDNRTRWILIGSTAGGGAALLSVTMVAIWLCSRRRRKRKKPRPVESTAGWTPLRVFGGSSLSRMSDGTTLGASPNGFLGLRIPFAEVRSATNNFDKSLIVGSGGFGIVYKAVLKDNTKVAVKRGMPGSRQGLPEFQTEIMILSRIRHLHLVSLVGYCEENSEMILVYEYMENGTLRNHLYGSGAAAPLPWKKRLEICIGAARGLHYLHTGSAQGIIHRDIKSTNILLDETLLAKVADFGLSRSGPCLDETHVSTGVKGSFGYLDPEYFRRQQLTDKSDVYSFGVVLFEVLCARPAVDPLLAREQVNLAEWALQWQRRGAIAEIVDPRLAGDDVRPASLRKFGDTAEKCLAEYGVDRPSMGDVLWNLESALQLQEGEPRNGRDEEETRDVNGDDEEEEEEEELSGLRIARVRSTEEEGDENAGDSGATNTSRVFSQLLTNDGR